MEGLAVPSQRVLVAPSTKVSAHVPFGIAAVGAVTLDPEGEPAPNEDPASLPQATARTESTRTVRRTKEGREWLIFP